MWNQWEILHYKIIFFIAVKHILTQILLDLMLKHVFSREFGGKCGHLLWKYHNKGFIFFKENKNWLRGEMRDKQVLWDSPISKSHSISIRKHICADQNIIVSMFYTPVRWDVMIISLQLFFFFKDVYRRGLKNHKHAAEQRF